MKKGVLIALVVSLALLAVALTSSAAIAQSEENWDVVIHPWPGGWEGHWYPGQTAGIRTGWAECAPGLVRAYLNAVNVEYTLGGSQLFASPEEANQYWGPIEPHLWSPDYPGWLGVCLNSEYGWRSYWRYEITDLLAELGTGCYELHYISWVDHPVQWLGDLDGDGKLDRSEPGVVSDVTSMICVH